MKARRAPEPRYACADPNFMSAVFSRKPGEEGLFSRSAAALAGLDIEIAARQGLAPIGD
jgi:hypothetical protein